MNQIVPPSQPIFDADDAARKIQALSEAIRLHRELNQLIFSYLRKFAKGIENGPNLS